MAATKKYVRQEYDPLHIAYLAGIIDGEGSIYIGNYSCNKTTGARYFQTNIQVTNTDKPLIDWLFEKFGGRVNTRTPGQIAKNSRKQPYVWTISGDLLTHICELILPFLICKKRQCEIMLKMRATFSSEHQPKKGQHGIQPLDKELLDTRQAFMDEMRALHVRTWSYKNHGF